MLNEVGNLTAEGIFGGIILISLLALIISGKLRLEREVREKDKIIRIKDDVISENYETIRILTTQAEVTNTLLKDLRNAAKDERGSRYAPD